MGNSLGFIEVVGMLGAIEACDTAVKAANVELIGCELTKGSGLVTITLKGNVGAVKAAVDAAIVSVERITQVVSHTVIARPSKDLEIIGQYESIQSEKIEKKEAKKKNENIKEIVKEKQSVKDEKIEEKSETIKTTETKKTAKTVKKNKTK